MRLVMMGTGTFAEPTFLALVASRHPVVGLVTNPDRPSGRERDMVRHIKQLAVERGIPVFQPESINTPEGVAGLKAMQPELLVVAAYGQILSGDVLNVAPQGGINVHASLLPKYRGAAPIAWAIYHGEKQTGVTIIRMSTRLDAGDMLAQEAIAILPEETAGELEERLAPLGAKLALTVIEQIQAGTAHGVKQDQHQVTKAPKLKKEHGLVDWSRTAEQVCNQIRAMQPWPTAYTYWHRQDQPPMRIIVNKAVAVAERPRQPPGTVTRVTADALVVAAGSGGVSLVSLQPAGKRVMHAAEFLRGNRAQPGDQFGGEAG
jgi:methionyl-tRNA formyltransferase